MIVKLKLEPNRQRCKKNLINYADGQSSNEECSNSIKIWGIKKKCNVNMKEGWMKQKEWLVISEEIKKYVKLRNKMRERMEERTGQ